jgi:hypothetical protein
MLALAPCGACSAMISVHEEDCPLCGYDRPVAAPVTAPADSLTGVALLAHARAQELPVVPSRRRPVTPVVVGVAAVVAVLLAVAAHRPGAPGSAASDAPASGLTQTWPRAYEDTSCMDWAGQMDAQQRVAAAAELLIAARVADGRTRTPTTPLVEAFAVGLDDVCEPEPTTSLAAAADALYVRARLSFAR